MSTLERVRALLLSSWMLPLVLVVGLTLGFLGSWSRVSVYLVMLGMFVPVIIGLLWLGWNIIRESPEPSFRPDDDWINQPISPPRDPRFDEVRP